MVNGRDENNMIFKQMLLWYRSSQELLGDVMFAFSVELSGLQGLHHLETVVVSTITVVGTRCHDLHTSTADTSTTVQAAAEQSDLEWLLFPSQPQ